MVDNYIKIIQKEQISKYRVGVFFSLGMIAFGVYVSPPVIKSILAESPGLGTQIMICISFGLALLVMLVSVIVYITKICTTKGICKTLQNINSHKKPIEKIESSSLDKKINVESKVQIIEKNKEEEEKRRSEEHQKEIAAKDKEIADKEKEVVFYQAKYDKEREEHNRLRDLKTSSKGRRSKSIYDLFRTPEHVTKEIIDRLIEIHERDKYKSDGYADELMLHYWALILGGYMEDNVSAFAAFFFETSGKENKDSYRKVFSKARKRLSGNKRIKEIKNEYETMIKQ